MSELRNWQRLAAALSMLLLAVGCGTTKANTATEQILSSDAVDSAVAKIDFTPLTGQRVFLETKYMQDYKGIGFVNSNYVISSIRQQMIAAGLLLQDSAKDADFIIEGRIGSLGSDSHEVVYGVPSTAALSQATSAASTLSGVPSVPGLPELSVARRQDQSAAAKIGLFCYEKETRERVWQSGTSVARSTAKDSWYFGIGPFQRGSIYNGRTRFAGSAIVPSAPIEKREGVNGPIASYKEEAIFRVPGPPDDQQRWAAPRVLDSKVQQAAGEMPAPEKKPAAKAEKKPDDSSKDEGSGPTDGPAES